MSLVLHLARIYRLMCLLKYAIWLVLSILIKGDKLASHSTPFFQIQMFIKQVFYGFNIMLQAVRMAEYHRNRKRQGWDRQ